MVIYILQKIGYAFLTLFGVVTVVFFLFTILPGDPARMMLDQREDSEQMQRIKEKYGFDKPISTQYLNYLNDLSPVSYHKDVSNYSVIIEQKLGNGFLVLKYPYLRTSFQKGDKKVSEIIGETLPNTAILACSAIGISLLLGLFLGAISALYANSWVDRLIAVISTVGLSLPSFFTAIIFAWVFGFLLKQYTGLSMSGNLYEIDDFGEGRHLVLKNLILPAIVLGIRPLGVVIQLMRSSLLEVLSQDYIRTARAKGLSSFKVVFYHAFRNALNPVITAISGWFASMLAGAVFVEYIFNWNGIGKEIVAALNTLDLPVIMGSVLCISSIFIFLNVLVDLGYAWLDPRVKLS
ncbi:ABC transporter permease [Flavobacteriaceae bacterium]|nr:ABC transporter permease [Flavobacteriaceae bacterium]